MLMGPFTCPRKGRSFFTYMIWESKPCHCIDSTIIVKSHFFSKYRDLAILEMYVYDMTGMVTRSISVFAERGSQEWEGGPAGWYRNCEEHSEAAGNPKPGAATAVRQSGERPGGWESYERAEDQGRDKEDLLEVVLLHSVLYFRADLLLNHTQ